MFQPQSRPVSPLPDVCVCVCVSPTFHRPNSCCPLEVRTPRSQIGGHRQGHCLKGLCCALHPAAGNAGPPAPCRCWVLSVPASGEAPCPGVTLWSPGDGLLTLDPLHGAGGTSLPSVEQRRSQDLQVRICLSATLSPTLPSGDSGTFICRRGVGHNVASEGAVA